MSRILNLEHPSKTVARTGDYVSRGDALTLPGTIDGIYNQLLFDLCGENDLVSLSLFGAYNKAIDAIGVINSDVQHIHEDMIVYVAASGAAADSPTDGTLADPCADGNGVESGGCSFELTGWGRIRRKSDVRDVTDVIEKWCVKQPKYNIAGETIDNDYEWDVVRLVSVIIHDIQRLFITGNNSVAGQADGLEQLVTYGYQDPVTTDACTSMDSTVVNYNSNVMCPTTPTTGITVNGVAVTDGYDLLDFIKSFLNRTSQRINMSSLTGSALHVGLATTLALNNLINCYVCDLVCGGDIERMNLAESRQEIARLRQELGNNDALMLSFEGYTVVFFAYDWALRDEVSNDSDMYILTPTVGGTPLLRIHTKDMSQVLNIGSAGDEFNVTDNNRVLSWEDWDKTCYTVSAEMQWRVYLNAPWAQMRIMNISAASPLGGISGDPLSEVFPETNLVAHAKA